jgi:hypothetical protein
MTVIHAPFDAPIGTSTTEATHPLDEMPLHSQLLFPKPSQRQHAAINGGRWRSGSLASLRGRLIRMSGERARQGWQRRLRARFWTTSLRGADLSN